MFNQERHDYTLSTLRTIKMPPLAFSDNKPIIRTVLCLSFHSYYPLIHLYISSAFTAEQYKHYKPVYSQHHPNFDGTLCFPLKPIGKLHLNFYGSKPALHTNFQYHINTYLCTDTLLSKHTRAYSSR